MRKLKRILSLILVAALIPMALVGCKDKKEPSVLDSIETQVKEATDEHPTEDAVKEAVQEHPTEHPTEHPKK